MTRTLLSRIARELTLRRAEAVALAATVLALVLTLIGRGWTVETNAVVRAGAASIGFLGMGVVAISVYVAVFEAYQRTRTIAPRAIRAGGWAIATVAVADVLANLATLAQVGLPSVVWTDVALAIVTVGGLATFGYHRRSVWTGLQVLPRPRHPTGRELQAIGMSLLLVVSIIGGVAFVGTQPTDTSSAGTVSAEETIGTGDYIYTGSRDPGGNAGVRKIDPGNLSVVETNSLGGYVEKVHVTDNWVYAKTGDIYKLYPSNLTVKNKLSTTDNYVQSEIGPDGDVIYGVAENTDVVTSIYTENMTKKSEISMSFGDFTSPIPLYLDGNLYVKNDSSNPEIYKLETGPLSNTSTVYENMGDSSITTDGEYIYGQSADGMVKLDKSFTVVDSSSQKAGFYDSEMNVSEGHIYVGGENDGNSGTLYKIDKDTLQLTDSISLTDIRMLGLDTAKGEPIYAGHAGTEGENTELFKVPKDFSTSESATLTDAGAVYSVDRNLGSGSTSPTVTGQVVDQSRQPVPNATVRVLGVDHSQLSGNPDEIQQKANDLLAQARNATPQSWDRDQQLTSSDGLYQNGSAEYAAVHTQDDWQDRGFQEPFGEGQVSSNLVQLSNPRVQIPAGEPAVISVWDPLREAVVEDSVDSDLPGRTVPDSRNVTVTQLGPGGSEVDVSTYQTEPYYKVTNAANLGTKTHHAVTVNLPPGFYKVQVKGSDKVITLAVGDPQTQISAFEDELNTTAQQYSERAKFLRDRLNSEFQSKTIQAAENGSFSTTVPSGVKTVSVIAYKGPFDLIGTSPQNATAKDLRVLYTRTDYRGSVVTPAGATKSEMPATNLTVETRESTVPQHLNTSTADEIAAELQQFMKNNSMENVSATFQQRLDTVERDRLENTYDRLNNLRKSNGAVDSRYQELLGEAGLTETDPAVGELSDAELRQRISLLEQAWYTTSTMSGLEDSQTNVGSDSVSTSIQLEDEYDPDDVEVFAHWSNGTTEPVPESYVSVDRGVPNVAGSTIRVSDYPIGSADPAAVSFEFRAANADGVAKATTDAVNPTTDVEPPSLGSISLSSLSPGPDERVGVTITPGDESTFGTLESATVYGPDGTQIASGTSGPRTLHFTTAGSGVHTISLTYSPVDSSAIFSETIRIEAVDQRQNLDPTIRVRDDDGGLYSLVGDGFEEATVKTQADGSVTVAPRIESDQTTPAAMDIYVQDAQTSAETDVTVRVLKGEQGTTVDKSSRVRIHTTRLPDGAYVYRMGEEAEPITKSGTAAGSRTDQADQTRIDTYTDGGSVTVRTITNPTQFQEGLWFARTTSPIELPVILAAPVGLGEAVVDGLTG